MTVDAKRKEQFTQLEWEVWAFDRKRQESRAVVRPVLTLFCVDRERQILGERTSRLFVDFIFKFGMSWVFSVSFSEKWLQDPPITIKQLMIDIHWGEAGKIIWLQLLIASVTRSGTAKKIETSWTYANRRSVLLLAANCSPSRLFGAGQRVEYVSCKVHKELPTRKVSISKGRRRNVTKIAGEVGKKKKLTKKHLHSTREYARDGLDAWKECVGMWKWMWVNVHVWFVRDGCKQLEQLECTFLIVVPV